MANVAHSTLTGADLHEPKGINTAPSGTVYVSNGVGSGAWQSTGVILFTTGQIADFATPVAPTGWLECDGATVARATFPDLFAALTIQQTGTRINADPVITGLTSTANMVVGYFVSGTGIQVGSTITLINSATSITLSANATSGGSGNVQVSPWSLGDGSTNFVLPNAKTSGRYRRSRLSTSAGRMGLAQADAVITHTHGVTSGSLTTSTENQVHTHTQQGTFTSGNSNQDLDHSHTFTASVTNASLSGASGGAVGAPAQTSTTGGVNGGSGSLNAHTHSTSLAGQTSNANVSHDHPYSFSLTSAGPSTGAATETRPLTLIVITCIKT